MSMNFIGSIKNIIVTILVWNNKCNRNSMSTFLLLMQYKSNAQVKFLSVTFYATASNKSGKIPWLTNAATYLLVLLFRHEAGPAWFIFVNNRGSSMGRSVSNRQQSIQDVSDESNLLNRYSGNKLGTRL
jgi:hypothetical protein